MDQDSKNEATVQINLFNEDVGDSVQLTRQVTLAALRALCSLGYAQEQDIDMDVKIHTIIKRVAK